MICPLSGKECLFSECMWWDEFSQECSIVLIGRYLKMYIKTNNL